MFAHGELCVHLSHWFVPLFHTEIPNDQEEQCWLFQGRFYSCWTVKAEASEGGLPAILKVVHLLSEQKVRSEGVLPTREPGIPSCAEWGWKAVQLPKVTAHIYTWHSCCTNRPRTQGRCPHRGWFSIGACLATRRGKTFESYATLDFLPVIQTYSSKCDMTHIVFDVYSPSSLKADTRSKRKVTKKNTVLSNWRNFLRHSDNKMELFQFLAEMIAQMLTTNLVIVTNGSDVLSTHEIGLNGLDNCYHDEADSRIFVHANFATEHGSKAIIITANDTDVVVIALSVFLTLQRLGLEQLWVTFGQGYSLRWISVHDMCHYMGKEKIKGILFFHAFTGCDTVSAFRNKGKNTAWQTWDICPEASPVFSKLSQYPLTVEDGDLEMLENFVIWMYDRSSTIAIVDGARLDMFARKQRPYEAIPPTRAALLQHTGRTAYQAGCAWAQATQCQPEIENPVNWGWQSLGEEWQIYWTANSPIAQSCQQLTKCGCKSGCRHGKCKWYILGMNCTTLCACRCEV